MSEVTRITAEEVRPRVQAGDAVLVCAYDSDAKFAANHLEGALSLAQFKAQVGGLAKDTELVFYCA